ncbi:DUF3299 domain-containing protein [Ruegeria sp. AU67]|uniref:DUF3299 domain-containing protein n=1 Tax=Ruegeria sp. AU67 TaxID=2108530 RepID=UPI000D697CBD|nr:DUF3299 domain-containing protein [Ruegeria sp. AU67]
MRRITSALTVAVSLMATLAHAEAPSLDWSNLIDPSVQSFEDPFRDLTYKQIDALRRIVQLGAELEGSTADEVSQSKLILDIEQVKSDLSEMGVDADGLISQRWAVAERRELASTAGNPELDGQQVAIGGFVIPAPRAEDGSAMAYLVPEPGMCSHVPPPPPNQMVQLRIHGEWEPMNIYTPIVVSGRLEIDPSERQMVVVDGSVNMKASFTMDVTDVRTPGFGGSPPPSSNAWAAGLAEKLKKSSGD